MEKIENIWKRNWQAKIKMIGKKCLKRTKDKCLENKRCASLNANTWIYDQNKCGLLFCHFKSINEIKYPFNKSFSVDWDNFRIGLMNQNSKI